MRKELKLMMFSYFNFSTSIRDIARLVSQIYRSPSFNSLQGDIIWAILVVIIPRG